MPHNSPGFLRINSSDANVDLRLISIEEGEDLRQRVLRPGQPDWRFPFLPQAEFFHMGAFHGQQLISVVSLLEEEVVGDSTNGAAAWRLRGMATVPEMQNRGIGGLLLEHGVAEVINRYGSLVWCYGRTSADQFYQSHGFQPHGEIFDIEGAGLHALYIRPLGNGLQRKTRSA
ncbi:GNAT family N-acetyltransferase [Mesorhizobium sp. VK23B]|uniref:GNAT family N-acetyltransferase n=1 Tax=Mesorhizobium dulcispinae TaxID=3072316 RepID=A0ABU4XR89_9HYPH|nr:MULTISPECIES: GNAT family N-acetyltransferase [unclassified Mesorhizobium]MDX8470166.1 GNAT family N-acetyltransferase [Mesorhizobium sp. VK23B]MDX8476558.1 GNAT family N-acetyltransferase [Mesorhizobium sp. VK23A]